MLKSSLLFNRKLLLLYIFRVFTFHFCLSVVSCTLLGEVCQTPRVMCTCLNDIQCTGWLNETVVLHSFKFIQLTRFVLLC